ncbi:hypothetical protein [Bacteroides sp. 51]|uniref:hypothetical protein n=1 Tax=Bacteroides sp. 51 TaxID=2302938 RepID=UPI0013D2B55E|nr:hypothetical protein [Bacteroides sp. 51]NDV84243.1 hypothetical protein [Bacteroides sp. 51]
MKQIYQAPCIEIIRVENEGIMANSVTSNGGMGGFDGKHEMFSAGARSRTSSQSTSGPMQDLEDALNDLFTVQK